MSACLQNQFAYRSVMIAMSLALGMTTNAVADSSIYQTLLKSSAMIVAGDSFGSGALIDADRRLVFTNYHVVGEMEEVRVVFPQRKDGELMTNRRDVISDVSKVGVPGRVVARDLRRDLALIEVESIPDGTLQIPMAAKGTSPGEEVHSIGNPGASSAMWVYTSGTVRQVYRKQYKLEGPQHVEARVVETQAPINQGDSGGPVVNNNNELVAIVSATSTDGSLVSVCVDVSELKALLSGDNSTIDMPVKQLLDDLAYEYELKQDGDFFVDVPTGEEASVRVEIDSDVQEYEGRRIRQIRAVLTIFEKDVPSSLLSELMIDNSKRKFGNWEVWPLKDGNYVFFRADIDRDGNVANVKSMMQGVASVTQAMRNKINGPKDSAESDSESAPDGLVGTWVGTQLNQTGTKVAYAVSLGEDGSYHWYVTDGSEEPLLDDRGTFVMKGETITFKNEQETFSGTLRIVDRDNIVYESKTLNLNMKRFVEAENPPTLTGKWSTEVKLANGNSVRYTLQLENGVLVWTVRQGSADPIVMRGQYKLDGNTLTYSTGGNSFVAELSLEGPRTLIYKDQTNSLTLKRA